jgi:hypothetical protein
MYTVGGRELLGAGAVPLAAAVVVVTTVGDTTVVVAAAAAASSEPIPDAAFLAAARAIAAGVLPSLGAGATLPDPVPVVSGKHGFAAGAPFDICDPPGLPPSLGLSFGSAVLISVVVTVPAVLGSLTVLVSTATPVVALEVDAVTPSGLE